MNEMISVERDRQMEIERICKLLRLKLKEKEKIVFVMKTKIKTTLRVEYNAEVKLFPNFKKTAQLQED